MYCIHLIYFLLSIVYFLFSSVVIVTVLLLLLLLLVWIEVARVSFDFFWLGWGESFQEPVFDLIDFFPLLFF